MRHIENADWRVKAAPDIDDIGFALGILEEIALLAGLSKALALDPNIGVDPEADLKAHLLDLRKHRRRIGEHLTIPDQIRPATEALPVAIQVQNIAGDII